MQWDQFSIATQFLRFYRFSPGLDGPAAATTRSSLKVGRSALFFLLSNNFRGGLVLGLIEREYCAPGVIRHPEGGSMATASVAPDSPHDEEVFMNQAGCHPRISAKWVSGLLTAAVISAPLLLSADEPSERIERASQVLKELSNADSGLPVNVLNKADCVIILPSVKKAGFIVGAQYGKGVMTCRSGANFNGKWGAPIMMQSSGGSFGLQAGGQATDFVILVMNDDGARSVMKGRAKLGSEASIAAGPVGRNAEAATTGTMQAQMLSYSRAQGVFGGVSLSGTSLGPDDGDNKKLYGKTISGEQIFDGQVKVPTEADSLLSQLETLSPKNLAKGK
jgi:lipid-binding SYLF domain-containing protein